MTTTTTLKCDRCGEKGQPRSDRDQLPKQWAQVRVTPSSTVSDEYFDLCGACFAVLREALRTSVFEETS